MKIQPSVPNNIQSPQTGEADKAKSAARAEKLKVMKEAGKPTQSGASPESAKAEISDTAKQFSKAMAVASTTPDVREDKISELKKRIADGNYKIDAAKIADRMVDDHMAM
ncbi:MAG: flagellar biosynthesis anti-sigma factor FlgM [Proteobacteria bacterium]|nr:MAG: flagellar biosynthesis anti-sigma factor FlgM [Pseudomonadota bacterium]